MRAVNLKAATGKSLLYFASRTLYNKSIAGDEAALVQRSTQIELSKYALLSGENIERANGT
jgi:hypothetical protein